MGQEAQHRHACRQVSSHLFNRCTSGRGIRDSDRHPAVGLPTMCSLRLGSQDGSLLIETALLIHLPNRDQAFLESLVAEVEENVQGRRVSQEDEADDL